MNLTARLHRLYHDVLFYDDTYWPRGHLYVYLPGKRRLVLRRSEPPVTPQRYGHLYLPRVEIYRDFKVPLLPLYFSYHDGKTFGAQDRRDSLYRH